MKKSLLVVFILLSGKLTAQSWSPINPTYKYNYTLDTDTNINLTIWTDSIDSVGGTNYHLNRILCDSCVSWNGCTNCYSSNDVPQFLERVCNVQSNGVITFSNPDTFLINIYDTLGSSWNFKNSPLITATILSINADSVFGLGDSIKTILLSTGDTIKLSMLHGLLLFPHGFGSNSYYHLAGIDGGISVGKQIPGFNDFFDFHVGDMFEYMSDANDASSGTGSSENWHSIHKYTITAVVAYGDSIDYSASGFGRSTYSFMSNYQTSSGSFNGGITVRKSDYKIHSKYPNDTITPYLSRPFPFVLYNFDTSWINQNVWQFYGDTNMFIYVRNYMDTSGLYSKFFGVPDFYNYGTPPSTYHVNSYHPDILDPYYTFVSFTELFKAGLGMTDFVCGFFEHFYGDHLTAYRKNGDTVGVFTPDSFFFAAIQENNASQILIYPNPCAEKVFVSMPYPTHEKCEVTIFDMNGRIVLRKEFSDQKTIIDVKELLSGIYAIVINQSEKRWYQKIIKE